MKPRNWLNLSCTGLPDMDHQRSSVEAALIDMSEKAVWVESKKGMVRSRTLPLLVPSLSAAIDARGRPISSDDSKLSDFAIRAEI
ncbi:MAG: hypothetical protein AABZ45_07810 [Pseudomonadota bacterium]